MFEHDLLLKMCLYYNFMCIFRYVPVTVEILFQKVKDDYKILSKIVWVFLDPGLAFYSCGLISFFSTFDFRRPSDFHLCLIYWRCGFIHCISTFYFLIPARLYLKVKE